MFNAIDEAKGDLIRNVARLVCRRCGRGGEVSRLRGLLGFLPLYARAAGLDDVEIAAILALQLIVALTFSARVCVAAVPARRPDRP